MTLIRIADAQSEFNIQWYQSEYLKWLGFYDEIPILRATINTIADSCAASWKLSGKNAETMTKILKNFTGNGKETFKTLMVNAIKVGMVGGDAYYEIVYNEDMGIENMVTLPSDNIRVNIKNGRIKNYEEVSAPVGEKAQKWKPEEIFHYVNNPIGAMVHGTSDIKPLQNLLTYLKQCQTDYADIVKNYAIPKEVVEMDFDDPTEAAATKAEYMKMKNLGYKVMFVPKNDVKPTLFAPEIGIDPANWHKIIIEQILTSMRVPDLALSSGEVNSEESARMKYSGFRQLVRMKQQLLEEQLERQLFPQVYPEDTPKIEFSFAAEPQEDKFARMLNAVTAISAIDFDPRFKSLLVLSLLQEGGIIEPVDIPEESLGLGGTQNVGSNRGQ